MRSVWLPLCSPSLSHCELVGLTTRLFLCGLVWGLMGDLGVCGCLAFLILALCMWWWAANYGCSVVHVIEANVIEAASYCCCTG